MFLVYQHKIFYLFLILFVIIIMLTIQVIIGIMKLLLHILKETEVFTIPQYLYLQKKV